MENTRFYHIAVQESGKVWATQGGMLQVRGIGYKDSEAPADPLGMERPDMGRRVQGMVLKVAKGRGKDGEEGRPAGRTWKVPEIGAKGVEGAGAG